ncbi:hypothetical protein CEE36_04460 [candidate division TA06 bacterium B3_TA06]|uniref:Uncharacterized protein n=1 Tax=candidate division TA06 bacterium B3_TA06 TaxID=2012487 RepID=A0A532V832_UNCT6|nr:MAG: hypothetical protein CEE36_04460 [candidate division TA06 bacterium B3_TA06]
MKRTLSIALLLMVGAAFAASTMPTQINIGTTSDLQSLTIYCWEGTASVLWDRFEIFYHKETGEMWGTWYRKEDEGGWIEGYGEPAPTGPAKNWIIGKGIFDGDDSGGWEGTFILDRRCWGNVWNMMVIGIFEGRACP